MSSYLEGYELKTVSDEEAQQILERQHREETEDVKAYTADELVDGYGRDRTGYRWNV